MLSLDESYSAGIKHFVSQHRNQLRAMNLCIRLHPFIYSTSMEPTINMATGATLLQFPALNDLGLSVYPSSYRYLCVNIKRHLERFQSTLTSFQLHTSIWTYSHIQHVFSTLTLNVRRFALTISCPSPQILAYLATTFPGLKHLVLIVVFRVSSNPNATTCDASPSSP
ncbi:hypothetical protein BJ165DRAFT_281917 [Panaeolus papilionaceus]|nr:hypothetical protein BJ165DRAFT_281917 [Panaeolus papilionaceus]